VPPRVPRVTGARTRVSRAPRAAVAAAIVVLTLLAFRGVLSNAFVIYDDNVYVTENVHVQKGLDGESIAWAFTTTDGSNWHPVTWLSHMLDVQLFGLDAGRHHGTNLLLHASNAVLLFLLLVRMTGALWRPAFVACLFAVHPLHVESVAWIAERKDVLSTLFWLLTLAAWLSYLESKTAARYLLVVLLYGLGLMAKPMLVTLPFTLLLLDFWPLRRFALALGSRALAGLLREKAPLFAMAAASCVVTLVAQRSGGSLETLEGLRFAERLANAVLAYASYLSKTFWPASLAVFYPHPHAGLLAWSVVGSALLLAGVTALALRLARRAPFVAFGWFWYVGTLLPVIGLVQVGSQSMADRYTYVPLIGLFVAISWGLAELGRGRSVRYAVASLAGASLVALFVTGRVQVGHWADSVALFEHTLAVTSPNCLAHNDLGIVLFGMGRTDEAIAHFREALRIQPDYAEAHNNLGAALAQTNRVPEALEHFRQAVRLKPGFEEARDNLRKAQGVLGHDRGS